MTTKADAKRRIVLREAAPGDVFDVQKLRDGQYLLVRLERPSPRENLSKEECLAAMDKASLRLSMRWDQLAGRTREP
jgi:hypothetical protein